eukprot:GHVN01083340.1.p1 GENE.GHVN01083340.1~~GHVN01083340.1.p1  ORF type:complete len:281 (-),score=31.73 GHVN01083340.1:822-1664(-)
MNHLRTFSLATCMGRCRLGGRRGCGFGFGSKNHKNAQSHNLYLIEDSISVLMLPSPARDITRLLTKKFRENVDEVDEEITGKNPSLLLNPASLEYNNRPREKSEPSTPTFSTPTAALCRVDEYHPPPYPPIALPPSVGMMAPYSPQPPRQPIPPQMSPYMQQYYQGEDNSFRHVQQYGPPHHPIIIQNQTSASARTQQTLAVPPPMQRKRDFILETWAHFWESKLNQAMFLTAAGFTAYVWWEWVCHCRKMELMNKKVDASFILRVQRLFIGMLSKGGDF